MLVYTTLVDWCKQMTIGQLLADIQYGQKTILQKLIMHYCALSREDMWMQSDLELSENIVQDILLGYKKYIEEKMPLEYIVGKVTFLGNDFVVNEHTLIPRPETEYMIEAINEHVHDSVFWYQQADANILLDVGTWCGVLGLSVLLHNPSVFGSAILSDMSQEALDVSKHNYWLLESRLQTKDNSIATTFLQGSLLEYTTMPEYGTQLKDKQIVLVANLPYIPDETFDANVDETVKKWEPRMAFVWGDDGLDLYRIMFEQLLQLQGTSNKPKWLVMFLEMMTWQIEILQAEFWDTMIFEEVKTFHFNIRIVKALLK